jgi:hypothetical protein
MTTSTRRLAATAAVAAVALLSAACSTPLSKTTAPATTVALTTTVPGAATPAQTKAAGYRGQLTYLIVEHVFLLGRVTKEIVAAGGVTSTTTTTAPTPTATTAATTPTTKPASTATTATTATTAAATTTTTAAATPATGSPLVIPGGDDAASALDRNSHDIADLLALAQGYGPDFGTSFYQLWSARISDVASYATAKVKGDTVGVTAATAALASNATGIATLVHQVDKYVAVVTVGKTGLADELGPDNTAVTTFVDAQVAKNASAVGDIVTAAEAMRHTAEVLAAAAAKLDPDQFPGTATGTAANLRAAVTSALVEHVELAALVIDELVAGRPGAPESAALAANTAQLADIVIVNFGDQAARDFTTLWNAYVTALEGYARGKVGGGGTPDLSGMGQQVGAFFSQQAPQLNATLIASDTQQMVDALKATVDAAVAKSGEVTSLRVAAATVPKLASDIAEGIAEFKPAQYLP